MQAPVCIPTPDFTATTRAPAAATPDIPHRHASYVGATPTDTVSVKPTNPADCDACSPADIPSTQPSPPPRPHEEARAGAVSDAGQVAFLRSEPPMAAAAAEPAASPTAQPPPARPTQLPPLPRRAGDDTVAGVRSGAAGEPHAMRRTEAAGPFPAYSQVRAASPRVPPQAQPQASPSPRAQAPCLQEALYDTLEHGSDISAPFSVVRALCLSYSVNMRSCSRGATCGKVMHAVKERQRVAVGAPPWPRARAQELADDSVPGYGGSGEQSSGVDCRQ